MRFASSFDDVRLLLQTNAWTAICFGSGLEKNNARAFQHSAHCIHVRCSAALRTAHTFHTLDRLHR